MEHSRVIKFRGKRIDNNKWVYGDLLCNWTVHQILSEEDGNEYKVVPETVGQFIGLKDSKGFDIYEGDILSCEYWDGCEYVVEYYQDSRYIGYWFPKYDEEEIKVIRNIHEK